MSGKSTPQVALMHRRLFVRIRQTKNVKTHWNQVMNIGASKSCCWLNRDLFTNTVPMEMTLQTKKNSYLTYLTIKQTSLINTIFVISSNSYQYAATTEAMNIYSRHNAFSLSFLVRRIPISQSTYYSQQLFINC